MRTIDEINKDLQDLVFAKSCEETKKILINLKLKNISIILNKFIDVNIDNVSLTFLNQKIDKFINSFSDLLTDNILDNFNMSFNEVYELLKDSKKFKKFILKELIFIKREY